jgi:hypothetical protein
LSEAADTGSLEVTMGVLKANETLLAIVNATTNLLYCIE